MHYQALLIKSLLIFLCCCCCSFSAVPIKPLPPQKKATAKIKQKKRQELRQKRQLHRLHKRQQLKKLQKPLKKHAVFNITGFWVSAVSIVFFIINMLISLGVFTINAGFINIITTSLFILFIVGGIAGLICCIIGLIGSKGAEKPKVGFGIAGLCILAIPLIISLIGLFIALFRAAGIII